MEINKYYIVKRTAPTTAGPVVQYARGYGNWASDIVRAKRYTKLDSVKRLIKCEAKDHPTYKTEILYVTEHIETVSDLLEKEVFGTE
jgi:hypothetical protein